MNRTAKVLSVVLVLIFTATVILSVVTNFRFGQELNKQRKENSQNNWKTFNHETFGFRFRYPPEAIVDISDPAIAGEPTWVRVRLIGPASEPNTEITDGLTFYVRSVALDEQETLAVVAERIFNDETENREVIEELSQTTFAGREAFTFSLRSQLGSELSYSIFEGEENLVYVTTSSISIPEDKRRNYLEMIDKIKRSLQKKG